MQRRLVSSIISFCLGIILFTLIVHTHCVNINKFDFQNQFVSFFNDISTVKGYLMPKPSLPKNSKNLSPVKVITWLNLLTLKLLSSILAILPHFQNCLLWRCYFIICQYQYESFTLSPPIKYFNAVNIKQTRHSFAVSTNCRHTCKA